MTTHRLSARLKRQTCLNSNLAYNILRFRGEGAVAKSPISSRRASKINAPGPDTTRRVSARLKKQTCLNSHLKLVCLEYATFQGDSGTRVRLTHAKFQGSHTMEYDVFISSVPWLKLLTYFSFCFGIHLVTLHPECGWYADCAFQRVR